MAGGKETPRQKMIGMMYLVLTALLALNVSKEILDAFVIVNEGLEKTTANFTSRNSLLYAVMDAQQENNPTKVKPINDKAKEVRKLADEMEKYIKSLKTELISIEDGVPMDVADTTQVRNINSKDKYDNTTNLMCGPSSNDCTGAKATELKQKLEEYKKAILARLDPKMAEKVNIGLDLSNPKSTGTETITWESEKFYHLPLAAVITLLSQLQTEIRNAEGEVVNELLKSIDAKSIKIDNVLAQVIPSSGFVMIGDEFTAKIFVAAYSTTLQPKVVVGGREITEVEDGMTIYKVRPSSEGEQVVKGSVFMKGPDGEDKELPFETKFISAKPMAIVSPTKMNVFYIGVDNPVAISVPGVDPAKVKASIIDSPGATLQYNPKGESTVKVAQAGRCKISVTAEGADGRQSAMGAIEFRIKRIPDPIPMVIGKKPGSTLSIAEIKNAGGLTAVLENFDFEAKFTVLSYEVSTPSGGLDNRVANTGARFSPEAESRIINKLKGGSKLYFDDIVVQGPDGSKRTLTASFKIN
jgi:gliding motility-associated protein GldM